MNPDPLFPPAPALSGVQACIVDLDGTLVDTLDDFVAALAGMAAELGLPAPDRDQVRGWVGKGSEHLIRSVLSSVSGSDAAERLFEPAWNAYQTHYRRINGRHAELYAGATQGLERLRGQGLRLACLTNKPTEFARELLASKGIADHFEFVFGGDAFARRKPDPLPVRETCRHLGTQAARTLVVGDSMNDAQAARQAGCPVVLVTYGYNHGQPVRAVDADAYIDSLADLPQLLLPSSASLS